MDASDAEVLTELEQHLLAPGARRVRRRFCAATAVAVAGTVVGLAVVGLAVLPVLHLGLVTAGLVLVCRTTDPPAPPAARGPGRPRSRARRRAQPLGCSTKS